MADDTLRRPRGAPAMFGKASQEFHCRVPLQCLRDLEKIAANEAKPAAGKESKSRAVVWLWEYWKSKEGR